jgi:hypothetical protein
MAGFIQNNPNWQAIGAQAVMQGYDVGAKSYQAGLDRQQKDKAEAIQQAIVYAQMKQKDDEFKQELARKQAVDGVMEQYRSRLTDQGDTRNQIMQQNADTSTENSKNRAQDELTKNKLAQDKLNQLTANRAAQADWVAKNRPQDKDYFDAFGKLPGREGEGYQTDPQTHALEQARKDIENEWLKGAKALKDHASTDSAGLDASDKVPGAKAGHEDQYAAIKKQMDAYAAQHKILTDSLYRRHMNVAGVPVEGDPFGVGNKAGQPVNPLGPGVKANQPQAPAVNIPQAPGFGGQRPPKIYPSSGNPHVTPGSGQTPPQQQQGSMFQRIANLPLTLDAPMPPLGNVAPTQFNMTPPQQQAAPAPVVAPEQKVQWLNAVAAEKGVKADAISQLPPATKQAVAALSANLRKTISDPNKLGAEITRQLVLAGFDPMKPPVDAPQQP